MRLHEAVEKAGRGGRIRRKGWVDPLYYQIPYMESAALRENDGDICMFSYVTIAADDWEVVAPDIRVNDVVEDYKTEFTSIRFKVEYISPNGFTCLSIVGSGLIAESRPIDRLRLVERPEKPR
jgi:hypothetical protein